MTGHGSTDQVGDWRPATIETPDTRVVILPDLGARVTSLLDRRSGREWLAQGRLPETASAWTSEGAIFGGDQAFGWDECLPTVAACVADLGGEVPAALRDHGALWGRPADVQVEASRSTVTWRPETWPVELRRVIDLEGDDVSVRYRLTSHAPRALPFLWSMHPLLTLEPGTRIELPGVRHAWLGGAIGVPIVAPASVPWPVTHGPDGPIDWSLVGERDAGIAAKLYVPAPPVARVVAPDGSTLELTWDRRFAPTLGVWVTYAGWHPDGPRVHQVALEPTTSADDDLATAVGEGRAVTVGPGTTVEWWVRISLASPTAHAHGRSTAS